MGSCVSFINASPPRAPPDSKTAGANRNVSSKSPPLPDEETVKEVLTELPAIRLNPPPIYNLNQFRLTDTAGAKHRPRIRNPSPFQDGDASDVRRTRTSVSRKQNYTTGNGGLRQTQRKPPAPLERSGKGSFPGKHLKRGKTRGGKYPGRMHDPLVNGIRSGFGCAGRTDGTASAVRTRPVVTGTSFGSDLGGAQSERITGRNYGLSGKSRKVDKWEPTNELLENPTMSLECFIFL